MVLGLSFIISQKKIIPRIKKSRPFAKVEKKNIPPHLSKYEWVGIDVSHYQGKIDWKKLSTIDDKEIRFVIIRASQGDDSYDRYFKRNWSEAKVHGFTRGAYHYYRPNENSIKQAQKFIDRVVLEKGDLPPVLDIERFSRVQSRRSLRIGLKKWLTKVEEHYGMKPIIYTGASHYKDLLKHEFFKGYPFWIANYNGVKEPIDEDIWQFWQFTDKGRVEGIKGNVDLNIFKGDSAEFQAYLFP